MILTPGMKIDLAEEGNYLIQELIGRGGFGVVYKVLEINTNEVYALKTLPTEYGSENEVNALRHDIKSAMSVKHENVIRYLYANDGLTNSELPPFIIMEYANGGSLSELVGPYKSRNEFIATDSLIDMFKQLIQGMSEISKTIIHRDIKTDNILIDSNVLKISDFGLAKFLGEDTRSSTLKGYGSRPYLAPEIWEKNEYSIQSDIYAMGIVFYELATLEKPIQPDGANVDAWGNAHLYSSPKNPRTINPNLDMSISQVIMRMIVKSRSKRFQTWAEIDEVVHRKTTATASSNSQVKSIVEARLKKDDSQREITLSKNRKMQEEERFFKKILYQIRDSIIEPLEACISEINDTYLGQKIVLDNWGEMAYIVKLISRQKLKIEFELIEEERCFINRHAYNPFGEDTYVKEKVLPKYNDRHILAWGIISAPDRSGYNLILVHNQDDSYGEWFTLTNTNSALNVNNRMLTEPIPIPLDKLYKEIHLITGMGRYNTQVAPFDIGIIMGMIKEFN